MIEICERLSTLGIGVNLVTYLSGTMHLPSAESANVVSDFMGTSFLLCLLGGFLADAYLGRYLTVAIFSAVQAFVSLIIPLSWLLMLLAEAFWPMRVSSFTWMMHAGNRDAHCGDKIASASATTLR